MKVINYGGGDGAGNNGDEFYNPLADSADCDTMELTYID